MPTASLLSRATVVANTGRGTMAGETIGQMVTRLRDARGLTQGQLSVYAKVTRGWLSRVEIDSIKKPEREMLERVANVLGTPPETLWAAAGYRVVPLPEREPTKADLARALLAQLEQDGEGPLVLPVEDHYLPHGPPTGQYAESHAYHPEPGERSHSFRVFKVSGECMAPEITPGEKIVVDLTREWREGNRVAVLHDGDICVKVLGRQAEGWRLSALDGTVITPNADTRIIGVVVEVARRLV